MRGEMIQFIESVEYSSKAQLLAKLRRMRQNTVRLCKADREVVGPLLDVAIEQVEDTPETELLAFITHGGTRAKYGENGNGK